MRLRPSYVEEGSELYLAIAAAELVNDSEDELALTSRCTKRFKNAFPSSPLLEIAHEEDLIYYDDFERFFPFIVTSVSAFQRVRMFEAHMPLGLRWEMQESVVRLFTPFTYVEVVQISYDSWLPFSEAIVAHKSDNGHPLLPSLRELRIGRAGSSEAPEDRQKPDSFMPATVCDAVQILASWSSLRLIKIDSRDEHYPDDFLNALGKIVDVEREEVYM